MFHFEPCQEEQEPANLLAALRQSYLQTNDYNRNLLSLLRSFEAERKIKILVHQPNIFGLNPLNPTSLVVWEPAGKAQSL